MKKLYTLSLAVFTLFCLQGTAQMLMPVNTPSMNDGYENLGKIKIGMPATTGTIPDRWFNYGDAMNEYMMANFSDTSDLFANNLFPDSTILVNYGASGYSGTWIHNLGDILDVSSQFFYDPAIYSGELQMYNNSTFRVDSLGFWMIYRRNNPNPSIVDTLVFEVAVSGSLTNSFFLNPVAANLGTDTVFFKSLPYTYQTNTLNVTGKQKYTVTLDATTYADSTAEGLHYIQFASASLPNVGAGNMVISSVQFVPGYTWNANVDTLILTNSVRFISYKERAGFYPNYVKRDFNVSYLVPVSVRYNTSTTGWNGRYIPSFAYMGTAPTYNYEHHLIYYKASCISNCAVVSARELESGQGFILGNSYPNPATGNEIMIPVNIISSNKSRFTVTTALGQELLSIDLSGYPKGVNKLNINTSNLKPGIYFYSVEDGISKTTKRFSMVR